MLESTLIDQSDTHQGDHCRSETSPAGRIRGYGYHRLWVKTELAIDSLQPATWTAEGYQGTLEDKVSCGKQIVPPLAARNKFFHLQSCTEIS
jgi:hypothetical protein